MPTTGFQIGPSVSRLRGFFVATPYDPNATTLKCPSAHRVRNGSGDRHTKSFARAICEFALRTFFNPMKPSTKNKVEGVKNAVKGTAKEVAGKVTKNPSLEVEGKVQKTVGKVQNDVSNAQKNRGR